MNSLLIFTPIVLCIVVALSTKKIFWALGSGILSAISILLWQGKVIELKDVAIDLFSTDKLILLAFTILLIFNTQLLIENGSLNGLISSLTNKVQTKKQALLLTFFSGLIIFFDDYANTLVIGNAFKPLAEKYKISREKLAFLVDSTAAPVACIAIISTWVGFELSQIEQGPAPGFLNSNSYEVFISSIPYALYPILMLAFILSSILWGRDFGPMLKAENNHIAKAKDQGQVSIGPPLTSILSIMVLIFGTMSYLLYYALTSTKGLSIQTLFTEGDPFKAMLFSSVLASIITLVASKKAQISVSLSKAKNILLEPIGILFAAWSLGLLIAVLNPSQGLHTLLHGVSLSYIPASIFLLGAILSFATGSSFGTMSILFPIAVPFVQEELLLTAHPETYAHPIIMASIASILSGAIFGDHCSPISDTTILSSTATECDHLSHFKTQVPYAITVGILSSLGLVLLGWLNLPILIILLIMIALIAFIPRLFGRKTL